MIPIEVTSLLVAKAIKRIKGNKGHLQCNSGVCLAGCLKPFHHALRLAFVGATGVGGVEMVAGCGCGYACWAAPDACPVEAIQMSGRARRHSYCAASSAHVLDASTSVAASDRNPVFEAGDCGPVTDVGLRQLCQLKFATQIAAAGRTTRRANSQTSARSSRRQSRWPSELVGADGSRKGGGALGGGG